MIYRPHKETIILTDVHRNNYLNLRSTF
uniref:Uncharacterized protein n=1 Tax=Anguilla anguilla TaxID=7936 RepID=A0A0E9WBA0_ANGAN